MKHLWLLLLLVGTFAIAMTDTKDDLVKLDHEWGVANLKADKAALEKIYADDLISVFAEGIGGKAEMFEGLEPAADTNYVTSDYKVMMLGDDTAVMAHNGGTGDAAYRSLHVWAKRGGQWTVVATANIPASN